MRARPFSFVLALPLLALAGCGGGDDSPPNPQSAEGADSSTPAPAPPTELSELGIPNATMPIPGILVGGQPSVAQLEAAAALGVRTIVNLSMESEIGAGEISAREEPGIVEGLGMRYVSIPVQGAAGLNEENARKLAEALESEGALPAVVHCASGNRVGALFALKVAWVDGAPVEEALEFGRGAGMTRLEPAVVEKLGVTP